jgi:hypothetical protein
MHYQKILFRLLYIVFSLHVSYSSQAQMITGVWHGVINNEKVEVKMIQDGDSITGTAYYYQSAASYRRYIIKGYFDETDNSIVWWDDQLIEEKTKGLNLFSHKKPATSKADFNCPGPDDMKLDGKMYTNRSQKKPEGNVHLNKSGIILFKDEWDYVIENYTLGANDRDIIDSVSSIAQQTTTITTQSPETIAEEKPTPDSLSGVRNEEPGQRDPVIKKEILGVPVTTGDAKIETKITPPTIEQKFASREKIFTKEIPLTGDSIELRFYDNAEIDGDSISLFLNGRLIFEHISLTEKAYVVRLAVSDLQESNELIMVAENLGSIPPNTSYMVAVVGDKRYDAQLASTENSSAMIKLIKNSLSNRP